MTINVINPGSGGAAASSTLLANPLAPGLGFEPFPRALSSNDATVLVSQRLTLVSIWLPAAITITSISFVSGGTAVNTGVHQLFGLFDNDAGSIAGGSARALLRGSTDDTSTAWGTNAVKTLALTSTYLTPAQGRYYIGIMVQATAVPTLSSSANMNNGPPGISPALSGSSSTGLSALPNPAGAISANPNAVPYCYVS